jgi:hypothetical protein
MSHSSCWSQCFQKLPHSSFAYQGRRLWKSHDLEGLNLGKQYLLAVDTFQGAVSDVMSQCFQTPPSSFSSLLWGKVFGIQHGLGLQSHLAASKRKGAVAIGGSQCFQTLPSRSHPYRERRLGKSCD